jgi:anti-sigma factor RsiW
MNDKKCCHELLNSISDYLDGTLEEQHCRELEKHLKECENCNTVTNTMRKTLDLYHQISKKECLPDDVRNRLFECLQLDEFIELE